MPPWPRRCTFHKANYGDESVQHAGILALTGTLTKLQVKLLRVATDQLLRTVDADRAQITRNGCPDIWDRFE